MSQIIKNGRSRSVFHSEFLRVFSPKAPAILAFFFAALVSVLVLDHFMSAGESPDLGLFGKKVAYLQEHHDDYNVLFIGTSSTYRAIDPVVLREEAKRQGCDVRAFNLGVSKLRLTELRHIRDQLPASMIGAYDLIVLSPMAGSGIAPANWPSSRIRHFSDWEGYKSSLIDLWEIPTTKRLPKFVYQSALLSGAFAYRQLGIGRLTDHLSGWSGDTAKGTGDATFDGGAILDFSRDGFVALDDEPDEQFIQRGEAILNSPETFERLKETPGDRRDFEGALAERSWRRFERAAAHFDQLDVPMLLFLTPFVNRQAQDEVLAEQALAHGAQVLNYNQAALYPSFFDVGHWFDFFHTNKEGAELVTEQLGKDICSFIDAERS